MEKLTDELEEEALGILQKIEDQGGMIKAVTSGWVQREIGDAAYSYKRSIEEGKRIIVGVNSFEVEEDELPIELLKLDGSHEELQKKNLREVRERRDASKVEEALDKLRSVFLSK